MTMIIAEVVVICFGPRMTTDGFHQENSALMAKCELGYLCDVCGDEVEDITESDLYLRYVLGEVEARHLMTAKERHLRCNPVVSQFIVDPGFEPIIVEGPFDKRNLDPEEVAQRESRTTQAWRRLQEVRSLGIPISEYPLERSTG